MLVQHQISTTTEWYVVKGQIQNITHVWNSRLLSYLCSMYTCSIIPSFWGIMWLYNNKCLSMLLRGDSGTLKCPKIKYRILLDTIFSGRCGVIHTTAKKYWGAVSIGAWGQHVFCFCGPYCPKNRVVQCIVNVILICHSLLFCFGKQGYMQVI